MENKLKKNLGMMTLISIAAGSVIGGWLAESPLWFETSGSGSAFIFLILAVLLVPVGLAFAEMVALLPYSSSVAVWTANATNHQIGWVVQWLMFLIQIVEPPLCAFILTTALGFFVSFTTTQTMLIAIALCILWYIGSNFNISLSGTLSNIFFYAMIIISLIVMVVFFTSGHWDAANLTANGGWFPNGGKGIFLASGILTLKFIGFEMTPTMIEETNFPAKNMWKVILAALFLPAILYALVCICMGGMAPWNVIAGMSMPEPELVRSLKLPMIFAWAALIGGSLHGLTTFMGFWTSSARVLYGSAELNMLPSSFKKLNKHGQPYLANIVVLIFTVLFCIFSASNWVQYIYAVSCIAAGIVYFVVCFDCFKLRVLHPEWHRPYTAPGGKFMLIFGMIISVWVVVASSLSLDFMGWMSLVAYMAVGIIIMIAMKAYRKSHPDQAEVIILTPEDVYE